MDSMKRQTMRSLVGCCPWGRTVSDTTEATQQQHDAWRWAPRLKGTQYATRVEHRTITNSSRKNEVAVPKWKQCLAVGVSGGESKIWCSKEQYCIGTWNVRSMNQGKLDVVKQEMAKLSINIAGISELKWMKMSLTPHFFSVTKCECSFWVPSQTFSYTLWAYILSFPFTIFPSN